MHANVIFFLTGIHDLPLLNISLNHIFLWWYTYTWSCQQESNKQQDVNFDLKGNKEKSTKPVEMKMWLLLRKAYLSHVLDFFFFFLKDQLMLSQFWVRSQYGREVNLSSVFWFPKLNDWKAIRRNGYNFSAPQFHI